MAGEAVCLFDHHRLQRVVGAVDKHAAECADLPAVAGIDGGAQVQDVSREVGRRSHLAAATTSGLGQVLQRSNDGGKTCEAAGNQFQYASTPGTHTWYDGSPRPWEFKRVWHLEPSLTEADTVFAGVEDAALFKSTDGATTWSELP